MEETVRLHGIADASLRRIAEKAGLSLQMVSHYFGNREELVLAFVRRIAEQILAAVEAEVAGKIPARQLDALIDFLFGVQYKELTGNDVIGREVWALAERDEKVRAILSGAYNNAIGRLGEVLTGAYPNADPKDCRTIAYMLTCLQEAHEFFSGIGVDKPKSEDICNAARRLTASLDSNL